MAPKLIPALLATILHLSRANAAEANSLTAEERAAGWILLFDGRSTEGWTEVTGKPFPDSWTIENGTLRALSPSAKQDLRTTRTFRNFELRFEWKVAPGGNSGVKYLVQKTDEWTNAAGRQARARGLEYQISDDDAGSSDPTKQCGALYGVRATTKKAAKPVGEFNESRIVVNGVNVQHWLNGALVLEFKLTEPEVSKVAAKVDAETYLSLQNHGGLAWFRNLKVRKLGYF